MMDLQDITTAVYKILLGVLPGMPVYNAIAPYDRASPYAVFDLTAATEKSYFGDGTGTDHTFVLTVKMYASRDLGAAALRRSAARVIEELERLRPTLPGLSGTEVRVRVRGATSHAGNNLWVITPVFSITGSATSA